MSNRLTISQIEAAATAAGFEPRAVRALLKVETGGSGYDATTGYLLIQFEPSWFKRNLPKATLAVIAAAAAIRAKDTAARTAWQAQVAQATRDKKPAPPMPAPLLTSAQNKLLSDWEITQSNAVEGQVRERLAFNAAVRIDEKAAQLSTSWGLPQMMGFNHADCGFTSVAKMVESFRQSEANQLAAMLRWISRKPALAKALRNKEWGVVAYHYNGAAYKQFNYDRRLAAAYASLT